MVNKLHHNSLIRQAATASILALGSLLLGCWSLPSAAAVKDSPALSARINLKVGGGSGGTALCRTGSGIGPFGATLTVVCSTGILTDYSGGASNLPWVTAIEDNSFRYLLSVFGPSGESLGVVDSYTGVGTVTTWRTIHLNHQDYLEMTVHW